MSESAESAEHGGPFALFEANLAAFKACAPHLAGRLAAIERPNTELVVDAAGRIDINFRGQGFYLRPG